MPEGFKSIDDLKVVIDANSEKMSAGLEQTRALIAKFAGDGTGSLAKLDGGMAALGTRVQSLRAAFGIWLPMLELGLGQMQKFLAMAENIAASTGMEKEFSEFKAAIDAIGTSIGVGLKHSFADTAAYIAAGGKASRETEEAWQVILREAAAAKNEIKIAADETATLEDATSDTAYAVNAFAQAAEVANVKTDQWLTSISSTTVATKEGTTALQQYADAARNISAQKMENPFGIKDPQGIIESLTLTLKQLGASSEAWVATVNKSDTALEGRIRSKFEEIQAWRQYADALAAGEVGVVSRWLFGSDPDGIRKKLAEAAKDLVDAQNELAKREKPTKGFDDAVADLDKQIAGLEQKERLFGLAAGAAAELLTKEKALAALGVEFEALNKTEQAHLTEKLTKIREMTDELKKLADTEAAYKRIDALGDEADALAFKISLLGQEEGAVARLTAEYKLKREAEGIEIDDEKMGKARAYIDLIEENTRRLAAGQASIGFDRLIDGIQSQSRALREQAAAFDMTAGAAARLSATNKLMYDEARTGQAMSDAQRAAAGAALADLEAATNAKDAASKQRALARDLANAEGDVKAVERRAMALYMEAGQLAEVTEQEKLLAMAKRHGIELDDARLQRIGQIARAVGEATRATLEFERQMALVKSSGQIAANALTSAFDQWMRGTEIKGREMVANLLREMAKLTLMRTVLEPAQGGINSFFGSLFAPSTNIGPWSTQTTPAFAQGGTLMPGVPSIVGERGPELIMSRERASVIPNHALGGFGGGAPVSVSLMIDARGATRDTLPELEREVANLKRDLPRIIIETQGEARDRGVG